MLIQKELLNKLKDFGLNTYESKLWTALLSRGVSTAGELSDIANVPRSRSYDVLESLEKKGFIIMKIGKPIKYIAVPPSEVIERVKKQLNEETKSKIKVIDSISKTDIINELSSLHEKGIEMIQPADISGSISGRNNIYNHYESLINKAKTSINIMTTSEGILRKDKTLSKAFKKASERGVDIKISTPIQHTKDLKNVHNYTKLAQPKNIYGRFIIIDGKETMFMLMDDKNVHSSYDTGIWVTTDYFSTLLSNMFESHWSNMKKLN